MTSLEARIMSFADQRWPRRTIASRLRKLGEEVGELAEAIAIASKTPTPATQLHVVREASDVGIILSDICSMLGYSFSGRMSEELIVKELKYPVPSPEPPAGSQEQSR